MFLISIFIFSSSISFALVGDDFIGVYSGSMYVTNVDENMVEKNLSADDLNGVFTVEQLVEGLKGTYTRNLIYVEIKKSNGKYHITLEDQAYLNKETYEAVISNNKLVFKIPEQYTDKTAVYCDLVKKNDDVLLGSFRTLGTLGDEAIGKFYLKLGKNHEGEGIVDLTKTESDSSDNSSVDTKEKNSKDDEIMVDMYGNPITGIEVTTHDQYGNPLLDENGKPINGKEITSSTGLDSSKDNTNTKDEKAKVDTKSSSSDVDSSSTDSLDISLTKEEEAILDEASQDDFSMVSDINFYFTIDGEIQNNYGEGEEEVTNKTEKNLEDIVNKNKDIILKKSIDGSVKIEKNEDSLSYSDRKKLIDFSSDVYSMVDSKVKLADKIGSVPADYFKGLGLDWVKNEITTKEDKIKETEDKLKMTRDEARGYNDFNGYEEKEETFSVVKEYVLKNAGFAGKMVQDQLDKLANAKKKALGKAAAREYRIFSDTYIESRKKMSNKEAVKAAYEKIRDTGEDALVSGDDYITFSDGKSNFFKEPIKFMSYKILNQDSKALTYRERAATYIYYLKSDKIYFKEGGAK